ncbi:CAP domain-containing protein [Pseudonocardiaceae bacterium YIM PH 21723]|nr:CAP domain-containing protein [Pseudonocardiaceae bacterium YIM PH 21723]
MPDVRFTLLTFRVMENGTREHRSREVESGRRQHACLASIFTLVVVGAIAVVLAPSPLAKPATTEALGSGTRIVTGDGGRAGYGYAPTTTSNSPVTTTSSSAPTSTTTTPATTTSGNKPLLQAPRLPRLPASPDEQFDRVLELVNQARSENGCGALVPDVRLTKAAKAHSADMADRGFFDQISPDGISPLDRARTAGFPGANVGENIAKGSTSAGQVFQTWMKSEDQKQNILNCQYRYIGMGLAPGWLWTQIFAS